MDVCRLSTVECGIRRVYRVGARPVLEATVSYPALISEGEALSEAALRFNRAYRAVAEGWLSWVEGPLCEQVKQAYGAAGLTAAYRFERRRAVCAMVAALPDLGGNTLSVTRSVRLEVGDRGGIARDATDTWRWPQLTLMAAEDDVFRRIPSDFHGIL